MALNKENRSLLSVAVMSFLMLIFFILLGISIFIGPASSHFKKENYKANSYIDVNNLKSSYNIDGFRVTAYCPYKCCNGPWEGLTATGRTMEYYIKRGINIAAVDPGVIPLGSKIRYKGKVYHAVDTGSLIKGKKVDILLPAHELTVRFGVKENQSIGIVK